MAKISLNPFFSFFLALVFIDNHIINMIPKIILNAI
nr:MAG TPA: Photosynthetic reaction centre, H-chain N-terminal region [Caudoviricetes sp.]DAN50922.1 MAG TPA: Photosynthetic reaction centre, H-chain N-terminal region [Caudoviricetes sp.]